MHVWRVETVDGIGPYHWRDESGDGDQPIRHSGFFPHPVDDAQRSTKLGEWLYQGLCVIGEWSCNTERNHPSATLHCAILDRDALRQAFQIEDQEGAKQFTVTCYEIAPLYVIVLPRQVLFDKRFATIHSREMFV